MQEQDSEEQFSSPTLNDLLFTLFRHKWKILLASLAGLLTAAGVYFTQPPIYQSDAKLLVRYVLDRNTVDPIESTANGSKATDSVIGSEVEILTSWDLAMQVAEGVGVQRLLPRAGAAANKVDAATSIIAGLRVTALKNSNVILVTYRNSDPVLAKDVLIELVKLYFTKHLEVHRSADAFDFVTQQTDEVRARLNATEEELKVLKAKGHVLSLAESTTNLSAALAKIEDELYAAEAERAEQRARVAEITKSLAAGSVNRDADSKPNQADTARQANNGEIQQYEALVVRLAQLRQNGLDLLSRYTSENSLVKLNQAQIAKLELQRSRLQEEFPSLIAKVSSGSLIRNQQPDLNIERARLAGIEARIEAFKSRDSAIKELTAKFSEIAPQIAQLERKRELEEENFKYFGASLEKAKIDERLDPAKIPNISAVQKPSPAVKVSGPRNKIVFALAGGGGALGIVLAFFIDFVLNTAIKSPLELETRLRIPLLLSIPYAPGNGQLRRASRAQRKVAGPGETAASQDLAPWQTGHFIRPFAEALRDRLVLYFELKKMVYKPKLVAVTSCSEGEGVSTVAAGLASALSETGDGKVLLVDMNVGGGEVHRFFEGKQTSSLIDAIEGGSSIPSAAENLYLAKASPAAGTTQIIPKRFYDLVPHFKATDFDYIIFDLPPLAQGSIALAMSGFMDKVLLVIEAEKSPRAAVKRTCGELAAANADVSVVFNKMRSYAPRWVHGTR